MKDDRPVEYPLGPALDFLQRLWALNHALECVSIHMDRTLGITAQQRLIVRFVGKYPGVTAGQLATLLHLNPGTISTSLKRLEDRGLLDRRRDPRDKRRVALGLTAAGRALDRPAAGTVEHAVERLLETARAEDIAATGAVLDRLTALLSNEYAGEGPADDR
ncbi:MAG: winged helix-turn-helix transcriptional regulator [Polyangiaceae bacterium]|nr:winged helix-turn-helix transcriptional regulator [Polyangiaceae bacterium]